MTVSRSQEWESRNRIHADQVGRSYSSSAVVYLIQFVSFKKKKKLGEGVTILMLICITLFFLWFVQSPRCNGWLGVKHQLVCPTLSARKIKVSEMCICLCFRYQQDQKKLLTESNILCAKDKKEVSWLGFGMHTLVACLFKPLSLLSDDLLHPLWH